MLLLNKNTLVQIYKHVFKFYRSVLFDSYISALHEQKHRVMFCLYNTFQNDLINS